jgi:hypothetical protein
MLKTSPARHSGRGRNQALAVTPIQRFTLCALTSLSFTNVNWPRTSLTGHGLRLS